jgi:hypothetical protein
VFEELGEEIKDKRMIENENIKIHLISEMHWKLLNNMRKREKDKEE